MWEDETTRDIVQTALESALSELVNYLEVDREKALDLLVYAIEEE